MSQHKHTIFKLLSPVYYTTKILGVTPYSHDTNYRYTPSKAGIIRSLVLSLTGAVVFSKSLTNMERVKYGKIQITFTDYSHICFNLFTLGCMMLNNSFKQKTLTKMLNDFDTIHNEIYMKLCNLKLNSNESTGFKRIRYQIFTCMLVNIVLPLIIFLSDILRYIPHFVDLNIGKYILFYVPTLLISFGLLHYVSYLLIMMKLFAMLNSILYRIAELTDVPNVSRKNIVIISHNCSQSKVRIDIIESMRKFHYKLCSLSKIYNSLHSRLFYLVCFKSILAVLGYSYDWIRYLLFPSKDGTLFITYNASLIVFEFCQIILWTMTCSATVQAAKDTTNCIQALSNSDTECYNELIHFSQQLIHHRVKFTVFGMITIDNAFLFNLIRTLSSYLLVVVQLQLSFYRTKNLEQ